MTTVVEILNQLSLAELSNLNIGNNGLGSISSENIPKLVLHLNEGLLRMHTKIALSQKNVIIEQHDHITNYHLLSRFAETSRGSTPETYLYIRDLPQERFSEDVIKVLKVFSSTGKEYPLNDSGQPDSVFTPQNNVVQVVAPKTGVAMSVVYQAEHPKLTSDRLTQRIELPASMFECLRAYVAYKVFSAIATAEAQVKAQEYSSYFSGLLDEVLLSDSANSSVSTTSDKFYLRGWI